MCNRVALKGMTNTLLWGCVCCHYVYYVLQWWDPAHQVCNVWSEVFSSSCDISEKNKGFQFSHCKQNAGSTSPLWNLAGIFLQFLIIVCGIFLSWHYSTHLFPPCSLWTHEPGHFGFGHLNRLRVCQRPAVPDGCHAHPPPVHPEEQWWFASDRLPLEPEPWWAALHASSPSTSPPQWCHADAGGGATLAEVHHLLRHWVW